MRGNDSEAVFVIGGVALVAGFWLTAIAAWITHVVWFFHHTNQLVIGLIGLFPPIGVIHGLGLWFGWWH